MTQPNKSSEEAKKGENSRPLICAKCEHPNPKGRNTCSECGAHLHIVCHFCGHRNERIASHCVECGKRLHRTLWRRLEKRLFRGGSKLTVWQIVMLVIAVYIAYKVIIKLVELPSQPPEE
jgi:hypothetical protein